VANRDIARLLPGDELIADPEIQIDRATSIQASINDVWPWIVQLGKGRASWYMPHRLERLIVWPAKKRSATRIVEELQSLREGDYVPDWGPGDPSFKVITLEPPRALVYLSLRDRANGWRWPSVAEPPSGVVAFSWALVLDEIDAERCRLHIRLRGRLGKKRPLRPFVATLGGLLDYLTVIVLFAGLKERVADTSNRPAVRSQGGHLSRSRRWRLRREPRL